MVLSGRVGPPSCRSMGARLDSWPANSGGPVAEGKSKRTKYGVQALVGFAVGASLIYNMVTETEGSSDALAILRYILIGLCFIGGVGSAWKYFTTE